MKKTVLLMFLLVSACSSQEALNTPTLTSESQTVNSQSVLKETNATGPVKNITYKEMDNIVAGCSDYLASQRIWNSIDSMPERMKNYFTNISTNYKIQGKVSVNNSSFLAWKTYNVYLSSADNKDTYLVWSKTFASKTKADEWLKNIPANKNVNAFFYVRKVNWRELNADPFVFEKLEEVK